VNTDVLIFAWVWMAAMAVALGLSLTVARHKRWGRPAARWYAASYLLGGGAQLVNVYTGSTWAPYLFVLIGPPLVAGVLSDIRSRRIDRAAPQPTRP
jgi:hypothetical protein